MLNGFGWGDVKSIYTLDTETDPFQFKRDPLPFCMGLFTGDKFYHTWGDDCIERMHRRLLSLPLAIVFVHNGGKFDFFYMMDWIASLKEMLIINGRIVSAKMWGCEHELRDSFAIMPFALKQYKKERIDYRCFEREYREGHRKKIIRYLRKDCQYLHELCVDFVDRFGDHLTIGGTSKNEMKKLYTFTCLKPAQDKEIREPFYYGGRVQCFEKGIIKPTRGYKIIAYDLNQCYPYSMREFQHPISEQDWTSTTYITDNTFFLTVQGTNHGAFPVRRKDGLHFDVKNGIFNVSIHEFRAATETGMFECNDMVRCYNFEKSTNFAKFVDRFHELRRDAQLSGDDVGALFYKYVGNSCYGKFAQNPDNYYSYMLTDDSTNLMGDGWEPCVVFEFAGYILWERPSASRKRYNVATAASITGAARSLLIHALAKCKRPLYCDTDSIICEGLYDVSIDKTKLGSWKVEGAGNLLAIGGRKLYALFDSGKCIKMASKGVHLSESEIVDVAKGRIVTWQKDSPTFDFKTHTARYLTRQVKMT